MGHYESFETLVSYIAKVVDFDGKSDYRQVVDLLACDGYDADRDTVWKLVNAAKKVGEKDAKAVLTKLRF
jgi:hypothetical protein